MIQMKLSKSDYQLLKTVERHLYTAFHGQYIHNILNKEVDILFDVYNRIFNKSENSKNCGSCRIRIASLLYPLLERYIEKNNEIKPKGDEGKSRTSRTNKNKKTEPAKKEKK